MNPERYTDINSKVIDQWVEEGWEWGKPISHEVFQRAKAGEWSLFLTPVTPVPKDWFCELKGAKVLGLASGGGQQMPILTALGAECTVLDYSEKQLESERLVAKREGYSIVTVKADMTKPLPFADASFDFIFHPVSNCYVENIRPIWKECFRVLKPGGTLVAGMALSTLYAFGDDQRELKYHLPFNPLKDKALYDLSLKNNWGIQFSHTLEEQIGGQIDAGLVLAGIYQDTDGEGRFHVLGIPAFLATRAVKPL